MRKLILFCCSIVSLLIFLFLGSVQSFAQTTNVSKTPEEIAKEKGITFPITELGNCSSFNSCRTFCDDPVNKDSCIDFAKKKGFYKEPQAESRKDEILKSAKSELGCDSESSCQAFCSQEANRDKCSNFAKSHNLSGGQTADPSKAQILEKAKAILGCDSPQSCKAFCEQEANRNKCSDFAKQVGLRGGEMKTGPGGCTSEETCRKFCSDPNNFEICQKFQGSVTGNAQSFHGPGGCTSPEECKVYCQSHPNECGYSGGKERNYDPIEMCNKTPNCSWQNNSCQCSSGGVTGGTSGDYEKFCRDNPDKCRGIQESPFPSGNINPQDYCKQYPDKCKFTPYPSPSSAPNYTPYPSSSLYPSYSPYPYPSSYSYPSQSPTSTSTPLPTTTTTIQSTSGTTSYDPATECAKVTGCTWTGSSCQCLGTKSVQGASTQRSFFQMIFQTLLRL